MNGRSLRDKLWFRLFVRVGIVFLLFVALLMVCNATLLDNYYISMQQNLLKDQKPAAEKIDVSEQEETVDFILGLQERYSIETEIYLSEGRTLYTTYGGQILDYLYGAGTGKLSMQHRPLQILSSKTLLDGTVLETSRDQISGNEYLVYRIPFDNYFVEMRTQVQMLKNSAAIANNFICILAAICFAGAVVWVFAFARRTARPITEMSAITRDMAGLDFSRKLTAETSDEIGELALSINDLSDKLDRTLTDLRSKNEKLKNEIEAERQLDAMRRGFVANVSHELKTPIAIIQGYADGLKQNLRSDKRDKYCDTIIDESQRMNKLVLSLLNLSKFESGGMKPNYSDFDISELLGAIAPRILKGHEVEYNLPKIICRADMELMEQALKGYLENAAAHATGKIKVTVKDVNDHALVEVYNVGERIDEKIMPQIWQSFYRGDTSHKRDKSRFGLGLSIVSAIAKLHEENCGVYNCEDGVTFWITVKKSAGRTAENDGGTPAYNNGGEPVKHSGDEPVKHNDDEPADNNGGKLIDSSGGKPVKYNAGELVVHNGNEPAYNNGGKSIELYGGQSLVFSGGEQAEYNSDEQAEYNSGTPAEHNSDEPVEHNGDKPAGSDDGEQA